MDLARVYAMSFASIYPMYLQKAKKKGRTKAEVDEIICWLTGHTAKSLQKTIDAGIDLKTFYAKAPKFQPKAKLIGIMTTHRIVNHPLTRRMNTGSPCTEAHNVFTTLISTAPFSTEPRAALVCRQNLDVAIR